MTSSLTLSASKMKSLFFMLDEVNYSYLSSNDGEQSNNRCYGKKPGKYIYENNPQFFSLMVVLRKDILAT